MKFAALFLISLTSLFSLAPQAALAAPALVVGNDKAKCSAAEFSTIQAAVNAAGSGDRIEVCAGIYPEQVSITKSVRIIGDSGAIVMPGPLTANGTDLSTGDPLAVIILVQNAQDVRIDGLIVDGSNNGLTQCSPSLIGILFQNASGSITHNAVRAMGTPSVSGCQDGDAIVAQSSSGESSTVEIASNSVHDYQKNGITGNEAGTTVTIHDNTVTESAPVSGAAPNGIQIGFGATGEIRANSVSGNVWSPCVSVSDCTAAGIGILIFESDSVIVQNNAVGSNQFGVFAQGDHNRIRGNSVFNSLVLDGIAITGNDNHVANNDVTHSDQDAVALQGNHNTVENNTITEALVGILTVSGSTGNTLSGNTFFATGTAKADPISLTSAKVVPAR